MPLWDFILQNNTFKDFCLDNFRAIGGCNNRLGTWDPITNNSRYYRALIHEFYIYLDSLYRHSNGLEIQSDGIIGVLSKVNNQGIGRPVTIRVDRTDISLDYLLAVEEYLFCKEAISQSRRILEIGPGFGRTCHLILSLEDIESYTIVDLPEILSISYHYLRQALPARQFAKVKFTEAGRHNEITDLDLVINIDSMQEMPSNVAEEYLRFIACSAKRFFTKNALGKYSPSCIDIQQQPDSSSEMSHALNMGLVKEIYPLFDSEARTRAVETYHRAFCPEGFRLNKTHRGFGQYLSYELSLFERG